MVGKRVQAMANPKIKSKYGYIYDEEAFADLLKKHKQPVGLMASLKESEARRKPHAR